jgi:hypothetical protein
VCEYRCPARWQHSSCRVQRTSEVRWSPFLVQ